LVGKSKDNNWKIGSREEDHIKINLKKTGFEVVNWIHLAQDRER
jgi:hypothetical protein